MTSKDSDHNAHQPYRYASRFQGKTAIITGAGSGIGRATLLRLVTEGCIVLGLDLDAGALEETVRLARRTADRGGEAFLVAGSILDEDFVRDTVREFSADNGRLDILINMAGILRFNGVGQTSLDQFMEVVRVNLGGTFLVCREALPYLAQTGGNIVNAASTSGLFGHPYVAAYSASKGGIIALTRTLAWEFIRQGVRVNAVAPGAIDTPMQTGLSAAPVEIDPTLYSHLTLPDPRLGTADQVASVIAMLASDDGQHINGEIIRIDGGLHR
jgi:NAD(P)-dependent dehydrogenase (short-subunit alcohol dehydrogenase family)